MSRSIKPMTRRLFLIRRLQEQAGASLEDARLTVKVMEKEHPEINMMDLNTWKGFINEEMSRG